MIALLTSHGVATKGFVQVSLANVMMESANLILTVGQGNVVLFGDIVEQTQTSVQILPLFVPQLLQLFRPQLLLTMLSVTLWLIVQQASHGVATTTFVLPILLIVMMGNAPPIVIVHQLIPVVQNGDFVVKALNTAMSRNLKRIVTMPKIALKTNLGAATKDFVQVNLATVMTESVNLMLIVGQGNVVLFGDTVEPTQTSVQPLQLFLPQLLQLFYQQLLLTMLSATH